jgi:hypothetical protein
VSESEGAKLAELAEKVLEHLYDSGAVEDSRGAVLSEVISSVGADERDVQTVWRLLRDEKLISSHSGMPLAGTFWLTARGFRAVAKARQDTLFYSFL